MNQAGTGFSKDRRLLKPAQFKRVFSARKKTFSSNFTAYFCHNDVGFSRLGLAISKKVSTRAVARNRIKRLIRESFRHYPFTNHIDIVVMANAKCTAQQNAEISSDLESFWRKMEHKCVTY